MPSDDHLLRGTPFRPQPPERDSALGWWIVALLSFLVGISPAAIVGLRK